MTSTAIENGGPRDWRSGGGFRCANGGCDRAKAVKRYPTRRGKADEEAAVARSLARTCADCGASETPLWRGGPEGPKSLCNACGIKYRKRKKALEPAATSENPSGPTGSDGQMMREALNPKELKKRQRSKQERMLKLLLLRHEKQRGRREEVENATEEHGEDVEAAALLLMSLSSGLSLHS